MYELYKNIKAARLKSGLTQAELASLTGYGDRSSIAKIEKGLIDLPQSKIELFARALGVSSRDLMGNDGVIDASEKAIRLYGELDPERREKANSYIEFLHSEMMSEKKKNADRASVSAS